MPYLSRKVISPNLSDFECDDFGYSTQPRDSENGRVAKKMVNIQNVKFFGLRPIDWIKRDLLVTAGFDDGRFWLLKKIAKQNPSFLYNKSDCTDASISRIDALRSISNSRAFDYCNRLYYLGVRDHFESVGYLDKAIRAILVCPTSLYATSFGGINILADPIAPETCKDLWNCPHCYARSVARFWKCAIDRLQKKPPAFLFLITHEFDLIDQSPEYCHSLIRENRNKLIDYARSYGGTGGIWTQQVTPKGSNRFISIEKQVLEMPGAQLTAKVSLMAEVPKKPKSISRLKENLRSLSEHWDDSAISSYANQSTLRGLLIQKRRNASMDLYLEHERNYSGLFYWPLLTVCKPDQWHARFRIVRRQVTARRWGEWVTHESPVDNESIHSKKQTAQISKALRHSRDQKIEEASRTILTRYSEKTGGKKLGRHKLREQLNQTLFAVSEREVRKAIKKVQS
jgi:hypothetical protein